MTDTSFEAVYAELKDNLQGAFDGRAKAARSSTIRWVVGLAVTAVLTLVLISTSLWPYVAVIGLMITIGIATRPMQKLGGQIKQPALEAIARQSGMTYQAQGFVPPGAGEAHKALFKGATR